MKDQNSESLHSHGLGNTEDEDISELLDDWDILASKEEEDEVPPVRKVRFSAPGQDMSSEDEGRQLNVLMDLPLVVSIELGRTKMSGKDLLHLDRGSVIELDGLAGEPVDVLVDDRKIAEGEVVVIGESLGVRITRLLHRGSSSNRW